MGDTRYRDLALEEIKKFESDVAVVKDELHNMGEVAEGLEREHEGCKVLDDAARYDLSFTGA